MQDSIFCPQCGTPNQAGFKFCTSCGFDLSTIGKAGPGITNSEKMPPAYTAPVQNQPMAAAASAKAASALPRWVPAAIIIVVLAGIGYFIWNNERSKKNNGSGNETGLLQPNDNNGQDNTHIIDPVKPVDYIKAKDFAGVWRAYESSDEQKAKLGDPKDDLFIEESNGRLAMYVRSDLDKEDRTMDITCDQVLGNSIICSIRNDKNSNESAGTIKLELQPSKNDMTVTITEASSEEKLVVKARRLREGEN